MNHILPNRFTEAELLQIWKNLTGGQQDSVLKFEKFARLLF